MKTLQTWLFCALLAPTMVGCSTTSAVMRAPGETYTVMKSGKTGFTPLGSLKKKAYKEANRFAASKGMAAEVISVNEVPAGFARWPQLDLRFRLVNVSETRAGTESPTISVNSSSAYDAMGRPSDDETVIKVNKDRDIYSEIKKLGELRDKGAFDRGRVQDRKREIAPPKGRLSG